MIILDIETTGNDATRCSIVQVAAMEFERPENRFIGDCRIFEGAIIHDIAMSYNGYRMDELTDIHKQTDIELARSFVRWSESVQEKTIVGENPSFDRDFMRATLERHGDTWSLGFRTIDIHSISYLRHIESGHAIPREEGVSMLRLDETLHWAGLPKEPKPHTAERGMLWEAEVFSRLIHGKNLLAEFASYPVPGFLQK